MSSERITVQRPLVGAIALACLATAFGLWLLQARTAGDPAGFQMWIAACIRVGMLMTALWLALPTAGRNAAWTGLSKETIIGFVLVVLALTRLQLRVVLPLFVAVAVIGVMLRPRPKHRPPRRR